ncbi:MAG: general secretion pathway protein GspB [Candidatus Omnitrophica bacterium]|nr:general secretion pathway protein GspB [Candidatus Omnitrophota bacterium]
MKLASNLFAILVIIFFVPILSSCKKAPDVAERVKKPRKKVVAKEIKLKPIEEEKFLYASHNKRDPFVPLVDKKGRPVSVVEGGLQFKASDLYLEGIIWDPIKPMAIINDEVVSSGDKIRGVTIIKIEKDKVVLSYQDKTFDLRMD